MAKKSLNSSSADSESSIVHPQNSFQAAIDPARRFAQDSFRLVKRCTKPDAKEFKKIALATTVGFLVMGFLGFFVKLVHIPSQTIDSRHRCGAALRYE
jgi:protein transport protein SEC61 subunit gamma-like protein